MKHLKKFNESKDIDVIKDICLELKDDGFIANVNINNSHIFISGRDIDGTILWDDVKDTVSRLLDYLGDNMTEIIYCDDKYVNRYSITDGTGLYFINIIYK